MSDHWHIPLALDYLKQIYGFLSRQYPTFFVPAKTTVRPAKLSLIYRASLYNFSNYYRNPPQDYSSLNAIDPNEVAMHVLYSLRYIRSRLATLSSSDIIKLFGGACIDQKTLSDLETELCVPTVGGVRPQLSAEEFYFFLLQSVLNQEVEISSLIDVLKSAKDAKLRCLLLYDQSYLYANGALKYNQDGTIQLSHAVGNAIIAWQMLFLAATDYNTGQREVSFLELLNGTTCSKQKTLEDLSNWTRIVCTLQSDNQIIQSTHLHREKETVKEIHALFNPQVTDFIKSMIRLKPNFQAQKELLNQFIELLNNLCTLSLSPSYYAWAIEAEKCVSDLLSKTLQPLVSKLTLAKSDPQYISLTQAQALGIALQPTLHELIVHIEHIYFTQIQ